jgi:hypothetical protein
MWAVEIVQGDPGMSARPHQGAQNRDISSLLPARRESQSRVRRVLDRSLPSTIPPRPHPTDAELAPLEWWLDAHMNVATNLMCLEQAVAASGDRLQKTGPACLAALLGPLGELRDALYELYCDGGDPRMRALQTAGSPLSAYVSGLYALCDEILETFAVASGLPSGHPELAETASEIATRCAAYAAATTDLPEKATQALAAVAVDATNPVDPLRNASQHLRDVIRAADDIVRTKLG